MEQSEQINELVAALARAQGQIRGAAKDAENPFFRSRYADLASVWAACRGPLSEQGLSIIQSPSVTYGGEPEIYTYKARSGEERSGVRVATTVTVATRMSHASGQWIEGVTSAMLPAGDPQAVGSAITYLRRYALAAMVGVAPEDDDGEATTQPREQTTQKRQDAISDAQRRALFAMAGGDKDAVRRVVREVTGQESTRDIGLDHYAEIASRLTAPPLEVLPEAVAEDGRAEALSAKLEALLADETTPQVTRDLYGKLWIAQRHDAESATIQELIEKVERARARTGARGVAAHSDV